MVSSIQNNKVDFSTSGMPSNVEIEALVCNEISMVNKYLFENKINALVDPEKRLALEYNKQLTMRSRYLGEKISYADFGQRMEYQIFAYDGKLFSRYLSSIDTPPLDFNQGAIMVMDTRGNLFLSYKKRNEIHHSTFFAGGPVAYACMLEIKDGVIVKEEPWSGHYAPQTLNQSQFHERLKQNFTKSFPTDSTAIFLSTLKFQDNHFKTSCNIAHTPCFDAVKLDCGHKFNLSSVKWWKSYDFDSISCPCDMNHKSFEISDLDPDFEARTLAQKEYLNYVQEVRKTNSQLVSKISDLQLSDYEFKDISAVIGHARLGIYLILRDNSTAERVVKIAKRSNLINPQIDKPIEIRVLNKKIDDEHILKYPFITLRCWAGCFGRLEISISSEFPDKSL